MAKNTNVISGTNAKEHIVDNYHFKVISEFTNTETHKASENGNSADEKSQEVQKEKEEAVQEEQKQESQNAFQADFIENLLKKTDEMSGNIIKLQMQIESQESEFNNRLNTELESAKEKFTQEGYAKAKAEFDKEIADLKDKYLKSVAKLDEACTNLDIFIAKNESELASTAIEIAKDVINKELEDNSAQIALNLSKELLSELKNANKIELRVSPTDYDLIKENLKEIAHLKVSLDDAISKGSVIVLSDVGNIEASLASRLAKIQKMVIK